MTSERFPHMLANCCGKLQFSWKANLMEIMILPLSQVSPIIQKTRELLPRGVVLDDVISNAHVGIVSEVFREFIRLCDCLDTQPMWAFDTSGEDWGELEEEEGFLPVNEELRDIRRTKPLPERNEPLDSTTET